MPEFNLKVTLVSKTVTFFKVTDILLKPEEGVLLVTRGGMIVGGFMLDKVEFYELIPVEEVSQ